MAWFSPFIYVPYYVVAIYAFIFEKEWIRVPSKSTSQCLYCGIQGYLVPRPLPAQLTPSSSSHTALMWGWGLLLTMVVVLREELYGKYTTKDRLLFGLAYGGYLLMPLLIMLRVARTPVFSTKKVEIKTKRD